MLVLKPFGDWVSLRRLARWWPSWDAILVFTAYFATRIYLLRFFTPRMSDLAGTYLGLSLHGMDCGQIPYADFDIQYPPLAWWLIALPRLLDPRQFTLDVLDDQAAFFALFHDYARVYRRILFLFDLAAMVLFWRLTRPRRQDTALELASDTRSGPFAFGTAEPRRRERRTWVRYALGLNLTYIAATTGLGHLLFDRLDLPLWLLLVAWASLWLSAEPQRAFCVRTAAAWIVLGLSVSFKVIPVLIVPYLLLATVLPPRQTAELASAASQGLVPGLTQSVPRRPPWAWRPALAALICLATGIGLPLAIQASSAGWKVFSWIPYHLERGLNVDSLWGSILALLHQFGLPATTVNSHDAIELLSPLVPAMRLAAALSQLALLAITLALAWRHRARFDRIAAYRTALWVLVAAVIVSNVFSPQYLIWALPLALLLAAEVLPSRVLPWLAMFGLVLGIVGLTTWLFPYHYLAESSRTALVPDLAPAACAALGLRNAAYLAMVVLLGRAWYTSLRSSPLACKT